MNTPEIASPAETPFDEKLLDGDTRREVLEALALGASRESAAKYAGCEPEEIERAAAHDPQFRKWLGQAEVQTEIDSLRTIRLQGKNWRAAVWILERVYPERYAPRKNSAPPSRRTEAKLDPRGPDELPVEDGPRSAVTVRDDFKGRDVAAATQSPSVVGSVESKVADRFPDSSRPDRDTSPPPIDQPVAVAPKAVATAGRGDSVQSNSGNPRRDVAATMARRDVVATKTKSRPECDRADPHETRRMAAILPQFATAPP